jgi:hypothetical protein
MTQSQAQNAVDTSRSDWHASRLSRHAQRSITNIRLTNSSRRTFVTISAIGTITAGPRQPEGALYHQVVDRYFDKDGNALDVKSATHIVDPDCSQGRRQQDLVASIHDDGKGNVRFGADEPPATLAAAE